MTEEQFIALLQMVKAIADERVVMRIPGRDVNHENQRAREAITAAANLLIDPPSH